MNDRDDHSLITLNTVHHLMGALLGSAIAGVPGPFWPSVWKQPDSSDRFPHFSQKLAWGEGTINTQSQPAMPGIAAGLLVVIL